MKGDKAMKSIFVVRSANENNDSVDYYLDPNIATRYAKLLYDHLTDREKQYTTVSVEEYEIDVPSNDSRTADELAHDIYDSGDDVFERDPKQYIDVSKSKVNVLKRFRDKIEETMVARYRAVIENDGRVQYKIYVWDDGEIECLEQVHGDNGYLVPSSYESRSLYYVTTIDAPFFNPWDYTDHSEPEDDDEKDSELREILDYLADDYESNVSDVLMEIIVEAEQEEQ